MVDLESLLGDQAHRLRGVTWSNFADLGRTNIERVLELARTNSVARAMDEVDRAELRELRRGIDALVGVYELASETKPVLPRLRNGLFRVGQRVRIYLGDTPAVAAGTTWVDGLVVEVVKGHRADWDDATPNAGFHWRVTVKLDSAAAGVDRVAFSTTDDPSFFAAFCANAFRPWHPLWCIERGLKVDVEAMDPATWLSWHAVGRVRVR